MAQKPIRLDDEVYTEVKKRADMQGRSYANLVNYYLRKEFGWLPGQANGTPLSNITPTIPEKIKSEPDGSGVSGLFADEKVKVHPRFIYGDEQPCCLNETQPCKHWVWDVNTGDGYKNILSGRFLEVE